MYRGIHRLLILLLALPMAGCFEIEQAIRLERDLSGTAEIQMSVDLEPMVEIMAAMESAFGGGDGRASRSDRKKARKEVMLDFEKEASKEHIEESKKKIQAGMPKGVRLTNFNTYIKKSTVNYEAAISFKHVSLLPRVTLDDGEERDASNPLKNAFEDLKVTESPEIVVIETMPPNPAEAPPEGGKDEFGELLADAFKDAKVTYSIEAPFEVLDSNATRSKRSTQYWEYDASSLEKLVEMDSSAIRVKYKR